MNAGRMLTVTTVAAVLLVSWYASQEKLGMGIAVAIVGLSMAYARPVLAVPAAVGMAAAALYIPGVIAVLVMGLLLYGAAMADRRVGNAVRIGYGSCFGG